MRLRRLTSGDPAFLQYIQPPTIITPTHQPYSGAMTDKRLGTKNFLDDFVFYSLTSYKIYQVIILHRIYILIVLNVFIILVLVVLVIVKQCTCLNGFLGLLLLISAKVCDWRIPVFMMERFKRHAKV